MSVLWGTHPWCRLWPGQSGRRKGSRTWQVVRPRASEASAVDQIAARCPTHLLEETAAVQPSDEPLTGLRSGGFPLGSVFFGAQLLSFLSA